MVKTKNINPTIENILKSYGQKLRGTDLDVNKMILYGSYAKGSPKESSDIDVCVVSPKFGKDKTHEMVQLNFLAHKIDPRMEVIPYNPQDLTVEEDPLAHEILKHGREIPLD